MLFIISVQENCGSFAKNVLKTLVSALTRASTFRVDFDHVIPIFEFGYRTYVNVHIKTGHTHLGVVDNQTFFRIPAIT